MTELTVLTLVCSLSPSPTSSSSELLSSQLVDAMRERAEADGDTVSSTTVRVVDHHVLPGVQPDLGDGDEWPLIRERVLATDVLVLATPTWMGQPSSVCQRVLERLNADISETDDSGRPVFFDTVAAAAVVGNEDGAHHITGILWQCLSDLGMTVPPQGVTYWNGEAMHATDFQDLEQTPDAVAATTRTAAANAVHLARLLRDRPFPAS